MSDHDFKLAARVKNERSVISVLQETITSLRAELEDVRQQRETLKAECNTLYAAVRRRGDFMSKLRAEVERRGEILKRFIDLSVWAAGAINSKEDIQTQLRIKLIELQPEIGPLTNAPDSSSQRG